MKTYMTYFRLILLVRFFTCSFLFSQTPPTPTITVFGSTTLCPVPWPVSLPMTSSATFGNLWSTGDTTQMIFAHTTGYYYVTQTIGGNTSLPSAVVTVTVLPAIPAIVLPLGPFCKSSPTVQLQGLPQGGTFFGDGMTGNMFDPSAANSGNLNFICYQVAQSFGNFTCMDTACLRIVVSDCVGMDEDGTGYPSVSVFPNLVISQLQVSSPGEKINSLQVLDLNGKEISYLPDVNANTVSYDLTNLPGGLYLLAIKLENRTLRKRVVKLSD